MQFLRKLIILPLFTLIAACGGTVYEVPADEAQEKLSQAVPPLDMVDGIEDRIKVAKTADGGVRWVLTDGNGNSIAQMVATIEESGSDAAEVTLDEETIESGGKVPDPKLVKLFTLAIREQVDATLTNRQFELAALGSDVMGDFVTRAHKQVGEELAEQMGPGEDFDPATGIDWAADDVRSAEEGVEYEVAPELSEMVDEDPSLSQE